MNNTIVYLFDGEQFFCDEEINDGDGNYTRFTWWTDRPEVFTNTEMDFIINCYNVYGPGNRVNVYPLREICERKRYRIVFLPRHLEYQEDKKEEVETKEVDLYFDGTFFYHPDRDDNSKPRFQSRNEKTDRLTPDEVRLLKEAFLEPREARFDILINNQVVFRIEKVTVDYALGRLETWRGL